MVRIACFSSKDSLCELVVLMSNLLYFLKQLGILNEPPLSSFSSKEAKSLDSLFLNHITLIDSSQDIDAVNKRGSGR
jgi:hypothetical protein